MQTFNIILLLLLLSIILLQLQWQQFIK